MPSFRCVFRNSMIIPIFETECFKTILVDRSQALCLALIVL
jgi:hypothetical protein